MNNNDRNCSDCIHKINGECEVWDCEHETRKEHDERIRRETIEQMNK